MKRIYLIFSIVGFCISLLVTVLWSMPEKLSITYIVLTFIPSVILFLGFIASSKLNTTFLHIGISIIFLISLLVFVFSTLAVLLVDSATTEVTDFAQYEELLDEIDNRNPSLVSFFPKELPKNLESVIFSYLPAFLQGGEHIQLKTSLSEEEIYKILSKYREEALAVYYGGDTNDHSNMDPNIPTTFFYTSGKNDHAFPKNFEIIVLYAKSCDPKECGFKWNHGETSGVAVNSSENTVVYWAESW